MASFSYTDISDYSIYDLFGLGDANAFNNNIRYIVEDIFGDPSTNSDVPPVLNLDQGIYWDGTAPGDATKALRHDGVSTVWLGEDLSWPFDTVDDRHAYSYTDQTYQPGEILPAGSTTQYQGWRMVSSGSIVAVSYAFYVFSYSSSGTVEPEVTINGSSGAVGSDTSTITATGRIGGYDTFSIGAHTFSSGAVLSLRLNWTGSPGSAIMGGGMTMVVALDP